jgi:hypothetical protein
MIADTLFIGSGKFQRLFIQFSERHRKPRILVGSPSHVDGISFEENVVLY